MSQFPKLNIDIRDLTKKPKKLEFTIKPPAEPPPKKTRLPKPRMAYIIVILMTIACITLSFSVYRPAKGLRKMIRMSCTIQGTMQLCSAYGKGEYVIDTANCDSFEFNGIPFVELTEHRGHYRIPSSTDMNLYIIEPCSTIVATVDTHTVLPRKEYAEKGGVYRSKLIWITDSCYHDFTVRIGTETVLHDTPASMIEKTVLYNKTAYVYESGGVYGNAVVTGNGCSAPIHLYAK